MSEYITKYSYNYDNLLYNSKNEKEIRLAWS